MTKAATTDLPYLAELARLHDGEHRWRVIYRGDGEAVEVDAGVVAGKVSPKDEVIAAIRRHARERGEQVDNSSVDWRELINVGADEPAPW